MTWLTDTLAEACRLHPKRQAGVALLLGYSQTTISLVLRERYMADTKHLEARLRERMPELVPAWLQAMRTEVERTDQARTALRLGVSEATVSQVLNGKYKADTLRIERRVRGELLGETVTCPVMFDPDLRTCQEVQERQLEKIANPLFRQAWFACRGRGRFEKNGPCPHFNGGPRKPAATEVSPTTEPVSKEHE